MWRASGSGVRASQARQRHRPRRGLSLLEAIAALAIVGATSAGVLAATGAGVRTGERARRALEAEALAEEQLARVSLLRSDMLQLLPDSLAHGNFAEPFDDYAWDAVVERDPALPGLFTVQVTVQWNGGAQSLTTALYRRSRTLAGETP